ncbi:MAG: hypothetical protein EAZ27_09525 [Cytophagales bacterium]|nr:MAG: hypothetical protein EAZ27_09525 [Cytophagales bacterium]
MAIITFTSDFGNKDHYVAAVKAKILTFSPNQQMIDISHHIEPYNIPHAAFVLNAVFRDFPKGTVHVVSVDSLSDSEDKYVVAKIEDHFFVSSDNGLLSLLSEKPTASVILNLDKITSHTFPEKNIFAFAAVSLANGKNMYDLGPTMAQNSLKKLINRKLKITKNDIFGNILHVDNYGNLISNITKKQFEETSEHRSFFIKIGREDITNISKNYANTRSGDLLMTFNDLQLLEIAIKNGNASQLLNMKYDSTLHIVFTQ